MLGADQRDWLLEELATTTARWNVLAQQTAFAPFDNDSNTTRRGFGAGDNWDGYVAERQTLLDWMVEKRTPNPITGDSHNNWVRNVPPDHINFDAPPVATEFMGTSISTGGDEPPNTRVPGAQNPHILIRNENRGYARCTLTPDTWKTRVPGRRHGAPAQLAVLVAGDLRRRERGRRRASARRLAPRRGPAAL